MPDGLRSNYDSEERYPTSSKMLANRPSDLRYSNDGGSGAIDGAPWPSRLISTQADQLWPPGLLMLISTISIRPGCWEGRTRNSPCSLMYSASSSLGLTIQDSNNMMLRSASAWWANSRKNAARASLPSSLPGMSSFKAAMLPGFNPGKLTRGPVRKNAAGGRCPTWGSVYAASR